MRITVIRETILTFILYYLSIDIRILVDLDRLRVFRALNLIFMEFLKLCYWVNIPDENTPN